MIEYASRKIKLEWMVAHSCSVYMYAVGQQDMDMGVAMTVMAVAIKGGYGHVSSSGTLRGGQGNVIGRHYNDTKNPCKQDTYCSWNKN